MAGATASRIRPGMMSRFRTTPPTAANEIAVRVQASDVRSRASPGSGGGSAAAARRRLKPRCRPGGRALGSWRRWAGRRGLAGVGLAGVGLAGVGLAVVRRAVWGGHRKAEARTTMAASTAIAAMTTVMITGITERGSGRP